MAFFEIYRFSVEDKVDTVNALSILPGDALPTYFISASDDAIVDGTISEPIMAEQLMALSTAELKVYTAQEMKEQTIRTFA